jgi:hypothetical protein
VIDSFARCINDFFVKLGIIGSRKRSCPDLIRLEIQARCPSEVISGGAKGIDSEAEFVAKSLSVPVRVIRPEYGSRKTRAEAMAAIRKRNEQIVNECDVLLAFPAENRTGGTERVIAFANKIKKPCIVISSNELKQLQELAY